MCSKMFLLTVSVLVILSSDSYKGGGPFPLLKIPLLEKSCMKPCSLFLCLHRNSAGPGEGKDVPLESQ